ncbi:hypothetical protein EXU57_10210 [Segetibacter sp. 3557_3]|uniref:hypothetical protein n=1 Tax=Segetibacter sp. 3557_3 TaxID=2547429 RepID=UPI00105899D8|nr:hypothetical protein [Segetibacter sp. 3557_3]TDH26461.1 hypothetical protein EXU57_10210 [Segetibacter sp. 3557_3]
MKKLLLFTAYLACLIICLPVFAQTRIDRKALVLRHTVMVTKPDTLASLSVGNGRFAFTTDITGLQTFTKEYSRGVPLGTQSEWGWHSFIDTIGYKRSEAYKTYNLNGRDVTYTVQWNSPERNKAVSNWFRQNPHRLQLGNVGFDIQLADGSLAGLNDIKDVRQELNMYTGEIKSHFSVEGVPVDVSTFGHQQEDAISAKVVSPLLTTGRLKINVRFPYPTGDWIDEGANYGNVQKHSSSIQNSSKGGVVLKHQLDTTVYYAAIGWDGTATTSQKEPHYFLVSPSGSNTFSFSCRFSNNARATVPSYAQTVAGNTKAWPQFWNSGAAVDFSGSTDKRAFELERRVILSQYLLRIQEAGDFPPQETGLTYNSWFGKPHLEMHYWHSMQYALWNRMDLLERSLGWYKKVYGIAKSIAERQGYEGVRWQKMTDNDGQEAPSSVGAFLIWQQPHLIYFAELAYRDKPGAAELNKYKDLVFATADFMASYPFFEKDKNRYILGKGLIPAQERFKAEETFNPTYELVYWHWALKTAAEWRKRLNLAPNPKWNEVVQKLSKLPIQNNLYLATESATDSYTNPEYKTDHPSVLGALGMMPSTGQVDTTIMKNTFDWVWKNWSWKDTWGWDFPMVAMTATRLGMPDKAIDALLMNIQTNTYLPNGHNYQDDRLRIYLPGNGGVLAAIAMMCAGYDGNTVVNPGIPKDETWKVRWEGFKKMP